MAPQLCPIDTTTGGFVQLGEVRRWAPQNGDPPKNVPCSHVSPKVSGTCLPLHRLLQRHAGSKRVFVWTLFLDTLATQYFICSFIVPNDHKYLIPKIIFKRHVAVESGAFPFCRHGGGCQRLEEWLRRAKTSHAVLLKALVHFKTIFKLFGNDLKAFLKA